MKIKTNDKVLITKGKDKGKEGRVTRVILDQKRVVVEGRNLVKKHIRPQKEGEKGKVMEIESPLAVSNVKLICPHCNKPTRVGHTFKDDEKRRICKKCEKMIQ